MFISISHSCPLDVSSTHPQCDKPVANTLPYVSWGAEWLGIIDPNRNVCARQRKAQSCGQQSFVDTGFKLSSSLVLKYLTPRSKHHHYPGQLSNVPFFCKVGEWLWKGMWGESCKCSHKYITFKKLLKATSIWLSTSVFQMCAHGCWISRFP